MWCHKNKVSYLRKMQPSLNLKSAYTMGILTNIYWLQGSMKARMMPKTFIQKESIWRVKLPQRWKGWQRLQQKQKSKARQKAGKMLTENNWNLTRGMIFLRQNDYHTLIWKENNMERAVQLHWSVKKRKQRKQRHETTRDATRITKIRASKWM